MRKILVVTGFLVAGILLGGFGHAVWSSNRMEPADVVAGGWKTLVTLQTNLDGRPKEPDAVASNARIMLSTQTLALALHYDGLASEEKERLEPFIRRARALPPGDPYQSLAVLDCIEQAGLDKAISETCIARAARRPGPKARSE